jgi:signal transduction histidine kinase
VATAELPLEDKASLADGAGTRPKRAGPELDRSHQAALATMAAVASYLDADEDTLGFFGRLCSALAEQTRARRLAFWRLGPRGTLAVQPACFGFENSSPVHHMRFPLGDEEEGPLERVIFGADTGLLKGTSPQLDAIWHAAGLPDVKTSIAAPWRAGERRIGLVAAYDGPARGFTAGDVWVLQLAGMAAGMLWQYKEAEDELARTAERLEEAMATRRHLLNNIAAGGDEARRRFASALHDDSLQLLTGAELQLERLRTDATGSPHESQLDELNVTLRRVEDSLRRLLTNVSPEPLNLPTDLGEAIGERLESMRVRAGIETHHDSRLPRGIPDAIQAIVMKNIAEALTNVEKHAHATRVSVVAEKSDGGVRVEIKDDGTGFVMAESLRVPGHIGLVALRERAQLAGGWCRIESDPGTGTAIEFWVPLTL